MKATAKTRQAADLVDVRRNGEGNTTYKCLKCGFTIESNAYHEKEYKIMVQHAAQCNGQDTITAVVPVPKTDIEALNEHVKMLAGHIKKCIPNGETLESSEAIALARISMATDLSPFTGEVWYIPKKGPHIGIRGLRRKAKEQSLYSKSFRAMTPEEIKEHDVRTAAGDVGCMCELFRHDLTKEAAEINQMAGSPVIAIKPIVGIGIWRKAYKEIAQYKDDPVPHGKSPAWVARKRAEADALSQAYDIGINLSYADEPSGYLEAADADDAGWSVLPPEDEVMRREAAINGERREQPTANFEAVIAAYKSGERELPPWVAEIRQAVEEHPKASDPVDNGMIQQLKMSATRKVAEGQFRAFVQVVLTHALEEVTFGGAAILMNNVINGPDFEARVVGLLS